MITMKNPATQEHYRGHTMEGIARQIGGRRAEIRQNHDFQGEPKHYQVLRRNLHQPASNGVVYDVLATLIVVA